MNALHGRPSLYVYEAFPYVTDFTEFTFPPLSSIA